MRSPGALHYDFSTLIRRFPRFRLIKPRLLAARLSSLLLIASILLTSAPSLAQGCRDYGQHMHWVTRFSLGGQPRDIAVAGDRAYVASLTALWILDVSDPVAPAVLGGHGIANGGAEGLAISGDHAFVAAGGADGLLIFDISDPSSPTIVGSIDTPGTARDVALAGSLACVADGGSFADGGSLQVIDVSNPAAPALMGSVATTHLATEVAAAEGFAFVGGLRSDFHSQSTSVVDLSDPGAPKVVAGMGGGTAIALDGTMAYTGSDFDAASGRVRVYDVSNPAAPAFLSSFSYTPVSGVAARGSRVFFAANFTYENAGALDVSDLQNPIFLASTYAGTQPLGLALVADYAYLCDGGTPNINVVKLADSSSLPPIGSVGPLSGPFSGEAIAAENQYAYVGGGNNLFIIDATDPSAPVVAGSVAASSEVVSGLTAGGGYAYLACRDAGLFIADTSGPGSPVIVGSTPLSGRALDVAVQSGRAYIALTVPDPRLAVVDVSNPTAPNLLGLSPSPGGALSVAVRDNYVYVANGTGVQVFDVSNPYQPSQIGFVDTGGAVSVTLRGDLLLVAGGDDHVSILSLADPANPSVEGTLSTGSSFGIAALGSFAYVDDVDLLVIDISVPSAPSVAGGSGFYGGYETSVDGVAVDQAYVYVLDGNQLHIFPPQCGTTTSVLPSSLEALAARAPKLRVAPNPVSSQASMHFEVPAAGDVRLAVYDATGRRARELVRGHMEAGSHAVPWNGRLDSGEPAPGGVYWLRMSWEGGSVPERFVLLR